MKEDYMEQILTLLVMMAGVSHVAAVADSQFSDIQDTSLYSLTLGGSVSIQLISNASRHQVEVRKKLPTGLMNVFTLRNEKVVIYDGFKNRTHFFINNGTLEFTNVVRSDSGQYDVQAFDPNGVLLRNVSFRLDVKEDRWVLILASVGGAALLLILLVLVCVCVCKRRKTSGSSI